MKMHKNRMASLMWFALFSVLLITGCHDPSTDTIEILAEEKSPNGKFIATSFSCAGGGAAGYFYFNASLRKVGKKLDQRDGLLGKHKTWKAFTDIEVRWIDDENLEVSYKQNEKSAYKDNNSIKVESKHGINIHYKVNK